MDYTEEEWWGYEEERRYKEEWRDYLSEAESAWNFLLFIMHSAEPEYIVSELERQARNGAAYLEYVSRPVDSDAPF